MWGEGGGFQIHTDGCMNYGEVGVVMGMVPVRHHGYVRAGVYVGLRGWWLAAMRWRIWGNCAFVVAGCGGYGCGCMQARKVVRSIMARFLRDD